MGDAFEGLPSWVNYIIDFQGATVYVETIEKGVTGRVVVGSAITGQTSFDNPGYTGEYHQWWKPDGGPKETLAVREPKTGHRTLTEEEAEVLQDLGLLDYALTEAGYKLDDEEQETSMIITVHNHDRGKLLYSHNDYTEGQRIQDVQGFAEAVLGAYKALGFQNRMEIWFPDVISRNLFISENDDSLF